MRRHLVLSMFCLCGAMIAAAAAAVEPSILFETVIPGYGLAFGDDLVTDAAGNAYVMAGFNSENLNDVLIAKIDPNGAVLWQQPIQGSEIDIAQGIALDRAGNVVVVGFTDSPDFPVTADALYPTFMGARDAFVLKLAADDGAITYGTFIGASHSSSAADVTVAPDGTLWIVGSTDSPDFPTVDPLQPDLGNYQYFFDDLVIVALSADGQDLLYSTFLGASRGERAEGIAVRNDGAIVVVGQTDSPDFPGVDGFQPTLQGWSNSCVAAVLAPDGSALLHATYLGGSLGEVLWGFDLGPDGSVYLAGLTSSEDFPTTPDAVQPYFAGEVDGCEIPFSGARNCYDGFLARLSPDLGSLVFGTYLGGTRDDVFDGVAVDAGGGVHVSGWTFSPNYPVTVGPAGTNMLVAQLSPDGTALDYAMLLEADGSPNTNHGVAVGPAQTTIYYTGARHVPAEVYVARLDGTRVLFDDGFESGDTSAWPAEPR